MACQLHEIKLHASPGWAMAFCCLICLLLSPSLKLRICSAAAVLGCMRAMSLPAQPQCADMQLRPPTFATSALETISSCWSGLSVCTMHSQVSRQPRACACSRLGEQRRALSEENSRCVVLYEPLDVWGPHLQAHRHSLLQCAWVQAHRSSVSSQVIGHACSTGRASPGGGWQTSHTETGSTASKPCRSAGQTWGCTDYIQGGILAPSVLSASFRSFTAGL